MSDFIFVTGEPNNSINPEYVRQGLRAVVNNRTQSGIRTPQSPLSGLGGQGPGVGGANSPGGALTAMNPAASQSPQQQPTQQQPSQQQMNMTNPNEMEAMRFNFDIAQPGK